MTAYYDRFVWALISAWIMHGYKGRTITSNMNVGENLLYIDPGDVLQVTIGLKIVIVNISKHTHIIMCGGSSTCTL